MKYFKTLILMIICLLSSLFIDIKISATENATIDSEELLYIQNEILVILTHDESMLFKEYSLDFFGDINCTKIEDLTSSYQALYLNDPHNLIFKKFKRILKLVINELSDNDINDIVKRIKLFSDVVFDWYKSSTCKNRKRLENIL